MTRRVQSVWLILITAVVAVATLLLDPIPQPPSYHDFADQRSFLAIPRFMDVASSLLFLPLGLAGLVRCRRPQPHRGAWFLFFTAFALAGLGSAWYHLAPDDPRLFWDRLPIAVAFMSLFAAVLNDSILNFKTRWLLPCLLGAGVLGVLHWRLTGDLRWYAGVQIIPLLCLSFLLMSGRFHRLSRPYLAAATALYLLAKGFEFTDKAVFAATAQTVSGHTLKHLCTALAVLVLYRMLTKTPGTTEDTEYHTKPNSHHEEH